MRACGFSETDLVACPCSLLLRLPAYLSEDWCDWRASSGAVAPLYVSCRPGGRVYFFSADDPSLHLKADNRVGRWRFAATSVVLQSVPRDVLSSVVQIGEGSVGCAHLLLRRAQGAS